MFSTANSVLKGQDVGRCGKRPYQVCLLHDQIIRGVHPFIRAGGSDFHFGAGEGMEEIGSAPGIHQLTVCVDALAGLRFEEIGLLGVFAQQCASDLGIVADRIATEHGGIEMEGCPHVLDKGCRRNVQGRGSRRELKLGRDLDGWNVGSGSLRRSIFALIARTFRCSSGRILEWRRRCRSGWSGRRGAGVGLLR